MTLVEKTCAYCGKKFITNHSNRKYCSYLCWRRANIKRLNKVNTEWEEVKKPEEIIKRGRVPATSIRVFSNYNSKFLYVGALFSKYFKGKKNVRIFTKKDRILIKPDDTGDFKINWANNRFYITITGALDIPDGNYTSKWDEGLGGLVVIIR